MALTYDPNTGFFYNNGEKAGGLTKNGYVKIKIDGKQFLAHRLAFMFMNEDIPKEVDHINGVKDDNRWSNLRAVTRKENSKNRKRPKNNKSGVIGVRWDKQTNRWRAIIGVDGKQICLGRYAKFSDAVDARKNAEVLYGFHKNHGR